LSREVGDLPYSTCARTRRFDVEIDADGTIGRVAEDGRDRRAGTRLAEGRDS
jgi:hypothetical protein